MWSWLKPEEASVPGSEVKAAAPAVWNCGQVVAASEKAGRVPLILWEKRPSHCWLKGLDESRFGETPKPTRLLTSDL
jgi:hypothetical protein